MASASTHVQIVDDDDEFDWEAVVQDIDVACQATAADKTTIVPNLSYNQGMVMNPDQEMWKNVNFDVNYRSHSSTRQTTLDRFIGGSSSNSRKFEKKAKVSSVINVSITRDNGGVVVWFEGNEKLNTFVKINPEAAKTWIYHVLVPCHDYQLSITRTALFANTLLILPTGLGKTLIAAASMYNFFGWFPEGKIVFAAASRPLVMQQIEACHKIVGILQEWTTDLTGQTCPSRTAEFWKNNGVFFITPQVIEKDIKFGSCFVKHLACLVFDEAHRATGNYSYCVVARELMDASVELRILALTATLGCKQQTIQNVIDNLQLSTHDHGIPSDVIEEILLRLPVKTLLRLKSVCSGWFSLIGSRSFAERHYLRQEKNNHLVIDFDAVEEYFDHYPDLRGKVRSYILGAAKGVVCEVREDATIILRNPATREMKTLPPLPVILPPHLCITKRLSTRSMAYGFGLDPSSGAYKMVAFTKSTIYSAAACVVYNSTSNSWKHLHPRGVWDLARMLNAMPGARWSHRQSRFLNGVYYWLVRSHDREDFAIFAFDMVREEFRKVIAVPERGRVCFLNLRLAIYRGSLALMTLYELGPCKCVDMWVMLEEDVWEYRFSSLGPSQDMAWLHSLWSHTNRHESFLETLDFSDKIPTEMSTRGLRMTVQRPSASDEKLLDVLFPYKESLLSIQGHYTY